MQANILEAKSQRSRLVKAAVAGEEVIIARDGVPMVRLVPLGRKRMLGGWGRLKEHAADADAALGPEADTEVARLLEDGERGFSSIHRARCGGS